MERLIKLLVNHEQQLQLYPRPTSAGLFHAKNPVETWLFSSLAIPRISPTESLIVPLPLPDSLVMVNVLKGDNPNGIKSTHVN